MNRRGFTLLELMISLTVGGIAITAIYSIGATATRTFHQQQQIASAQTALRNAVNQVKRDIARAGYLFTPNANAPFGYVQQTCSVVGSPMHSPQLAGGITGGSLAAIARFTNDVAITVANDNTAVDPTGVNAANGFTNDEIVLFANYETASEYHIKWVAEDTIAIPQSWQSFQRDFTDWVNGNDGVFDPVRFNEAFTVGRLIRIQTTRSQRHYAQIRRVIAPANPGDDVRIEFSPTVPTTCTSEVEGGWVAPISAIRYFVRNAPAPQNERFVDSTGPIAQLLRSEVDPITKLAPLFGNPDPGMRAVLDYVVGFNLAFTMNGATASGEPDDYQAGILVGDQSDNIVPFTGNANNIVNSNPERIRAVSIEVAVRAPEQDARIAFDATGCAGLRCFQVFSDSGTGARQGSARVRRERAEVFVPNIAFEGY